MAFKTPQTSVCLLLLISVLYFITGKTTAAVASREKCECVEETGSVHLKKIRDYTIIQKDPLCNKVQIIVELSGKQTCLNPNSNQGKKLQECWRRYKSNPKMKKSCWQSKRKNPSKKKPKKL